MIGKQFREAVCRLCPHRLVWGKKDECCYEANYACHLPAKDRPARVSLDLLEACPDPKRGREK